MFWQSQGREIDSRVFLSSENESKSFSDVFEMGDTLFDGLERGVVAILCEKTVDTVAAYVGALRNNMVPLMIGADLRKEALTRVVDAYQPKYIFAPAATAIPVGFTETRQFRNSRLLASHSENVELHPELALLLPTSGSTGDPKCVRLSQKNIQSCAKAVCEYLDLDETRCAVSLLPLQYSYGLSVLHNALQSRSGYVLTDYSVLDREFWALVVDKKITDFSGVPFVFETLRRMRFSDEVMRTLKCVTQAGGRLDPKLTKLFCEKFSEAGIRYFTMYGQTEASPRISYLPPERAAEKLGSVGLPISCGDARILETGATVGEGELLYIGDNVCLGYAKDKDDLTLGDQFQGKLATGDHVRIDEDGYIFILGRRKRFIKLQGISVNLDHVESVLKSHDLECVVIGKENKIRVFHCDVDEANLSAIVDSNFNFHPSSLKYIKLDTLPLNASGKPDYAALTDAYL